MLKDPVGVFGVCSSCGVGPQGLYHYDGDTPANLCSNCARRLSFLVDTIPPVGGYLRNTEVQQMAEHHVTIQIVSDPPDKVVGDWVETETGVWCLYNLEGGIAAEIVRDAPGLGRPECFRWAPHRVRGDDDEGDASSLQGAKHDVARYLRLTTLEKSVIDQVHMADEHVHNYVDDGVRYSYDDEIDRRASYGGRRWRLYFRVFRCTTCFDRRAERIASDGDTRNPESDMDPVKHGAVRATDREVQTYREQR